MGQKRVSIKMTAQTIHRPQLKIRTRAERQKAFLGKMWKIWLPVFVVALTSSRTTLATSDDNDATLSFENQVDKRSSPYDYYLAKMMEGIRDDLCSKESINELVPKVINMKRMIIKRLANPRVPSQRSFIGELEGSAEEGDDGSNPIPSWKLHEWTKQVYDIERRLAFCNRRNNVSKIRLL